MAPTSRQDEPKTSRAARKTAGARKRRRGGRNKRPQDPSKSDPDSGVLPRKADAGLQDGVGETLSPQEVRSIREHFDFLRTHRKILRLKVNAAEDLLLNGTQEPSQRGACQHLLNKVDRSCVISACERLEAGAAAKLLAGIVLFSSDIEYILLLLEKIQLSGSPDDTTAALAQGIERIDFNVVSKAQMRRVLSLIAEIFTEHERPEVLLGLLESRSFRAAFDKSIESLPTALASLVVPLRAAQAVILHGKPNTYDPPDLCRGVGMLLSGSDRSLRRRPQEVRERLLDYGLQACHAPAHAHHAPLATLLASFSKKGRQHGDAGIALAQHLLGAECDGEARRLLKELARDHPEFKLPNRWLERVESPERIGRFAIEADHPEKRDVLGQHRRRSGYWIDTMQNAWIQIGSMEHVDSMTTAASILSDHCIPNMVPLLESGMTRDGSPYFVTPNPGRPLEAVLAQNRGVELGEALRVCLAGSTLFGALTAAGLELRDGDLARFAQNENGALWLLDVCGALRARPTDGTDHNLPAAREFCEHVLRIGTRYLPPLDLLAQIQTAETCGHLVRSLARSSRLGSRSTARPAKKRPRARRS